MILTYTEALKQFNDLQNESSREYVERVGFNAAETHYRSEFIQKAKDFINLFSEIEGNFDTQAIEELICKAQFLAIRGNAYAEIKNNEQQS
jgi:hypothetical protein